VNERKLLRRLLASPTNARFEDVRSLIEAFGFRLVRVSGGHHIFSHPAVPELVNLQEVAGEAKPYQVRQFLRLIERHNLTLDDTG
jgi:predicted RNA binding protein YcfA (HicA-like mRNA interferase family)